MQPTGHPGRVAMIKVIAIGCIVLACAGNVHPSWPVAQARRVRHIVIQTTYKPDGVPDQVAGAPPESISHSDRMQFTYYVDSVNGNDANPGTLTAPWKSIAKVNAVTLVPGQSVGFKRGGVWREALRPKESGLAGRPLVFGAYGKGHKPIINGAHAVSRFTITRGAHVWHARVPTRPHVLWIDSRSLGPPVAAKVDLARVDQWYWHQGILYLDSIEDPTHGHTIEAAAVPYPVDINGVSYIIVDGLEVTNGNSADVELRASSYDTIRNMTIHDSSGDGIYAGLGGGGHTIDNCDIYRTGLNQIFGHGSGIQFNGMEAPPLTIPSIIQRNYIHNIDSPTGGDHAIYDEVSRDVDRYNDFKDIRGGTAMKIDGNAVLVYRNLFDTIPSGGIWVDAYNEVKIYNNTFYNVGSVSPYAAISLTGGAGKSGVSVINNIDYHAGSSYSVFLNINNTITGFSSNFNDAFGVWWAESTGHRAYNSLKSWVRATKQDAKSISADPRFVGHSASRFTLRETSPAVGRGMYIPGITARLRPNIGAK